MGPAPGKVRANPWGAKPKPKKKPTVAVCGRRLFLGIQILLAALSLASLLTAAAKLAAVAEQTMAASPPDPDPGARKLAFHEPRPCPACGRMYRSEGRLHCALLDR